MGKPKKGTLLVTSKNSTTDEVSVEDQNDTSQISDFNSNEPSRITDRSDLERITEESENGSATERLTETISNLFESTVTKSDRQKNVMIKRKKNTTGKLIKRMKKKKKDFKSFRLYLFRLQRTVSPDLTLSKMSMEIMNSFVYDIFERLSKEAETLMHYQKKMTLTSREIQAACQLVLTGEILKRANMNGINAVGEYNRSVKEDLELRNQKKLKQKQIYAKSTKTGKAENDENFIGIEANKRTNRKVSEDDLIKKSKNKNVLKRKN